MLHFVCPKSGLEFPEDGFSAALHGFVVGVGFVVAAGEVQEAVRVAPSAWAWSAA